MAEAVLNEMQMLDQQIAAPLAMTEQFTDLGMRGRIDLPALRHRPRTPAAVATGAVCLGF
jgi:hypothetical protein